MNPILQIYIFPQLPDEYLPAQQCSHVCMTCTLRWLARATLLQRSAHGVHVLGCVVDSKPACDSAQSRTLCLKFTLSRLVKHLIGSEAFQHGANA